MWKRCRKWRRRRSAAGPSRSRFRAGAVDRDRVAVVACSRFSEARARPLDPARVVHDDLEPRGRRARAGTPPAFARAPRRSSPSATDRRRRRGSSACARPISSSIAAICAATVSSASSRQRTGGWPRQATSGGGSHGGTSRREAWRRRRAAPRPRARASARALASRRSVAAAVRRPAQRRAVDVECASS